MTVTALPFITLASAPILFGTLYTYDEATDTCKLTHWGNKMSWPQISHLVHSNDGPQCLRACSPSIGAAAASLAWGCSLLQCNSVRLFHDSLQKQANVSLTSFQKVGLQPCIFARCVGFWGVLASKRFFFGGGWIDTNLENVKNIKVSQTTTPLNHKVYRLTTSLNEDSQKLICDCFRTIPRHQTKLTSRGVPGAGGTVRLASVVSLVPCQWVNSRWDSPYILLPTVPLLTIANLPFGSSGI